MSATNGSAVPSETTSATDKGKGKSIDPNPSHAPMEEDDDDESDEEESGAEEDHGEPEEEDEDNMEEIDTANIVGGRTRNKNIDWAEAERKSKEAGDDLDEEDEDDDEDFEAPEDKMEE